MKKVASLLSLPLLLAACGQVASTPTSTYASTSAKPSTYINDFESKVAFDLQALDLNGVVTSQASATPKSYLNVLRLSDSSARAYIKTTYGSNTPCTLDWGDGQSSAVMTPTPTNLNAQTLSHEYTQSGAYVVKLTCADNVKSVGFTATVPQSILDFEDLQPIVGNGGFLFVSSPYLYQGMAFEGSSIVIDNGIYLPQGHTGLCICAPITMRKADNSAFSLKSVTVASSGQPVTLTAYNANNDVVGQTTFSNSTSSYATLTLNWANVTRVVSSDSSWWIDALSIGR